MARLLPRELFSRIVMRYAGRQRPNSRLGSYIERMVNYSNRAIITHELAGQRVKVWHELQPDPVHRYEIYSYVFDNFVVEPVDHLEFGVHRGGSIRWVLSKLGPDSRLFGFDSFEGLPEDWYFGVQKGEFAVEAEPAIVAENVRFIKGWFENSLEPFLASTELKPRLVVHMDADLYSSTICVFRALRDRLVPGSIVIFDEYWFVKDEFRALREFVDESGKCFEYIAVTATRAAIRFV